MQRTVRAAVATVIAAAVGFGITVPAASAAPKDKPAHVKADKGSPKTKAVDTAESTKGAKATKGGKAQKGKSTKAKSGPAVRAERFVRNVTRQAGVIERKVTANEERVAGNAEAEAALEAAVVAVESAIAKVAAISGAVSKAERRAVLVDLRTARRALADVAVALDEEAPVTEEPVVEEPVTEEPVVEEPVTEQPATEQPATEQPVTEEPVTEPTA